MSGAVGERWDERTWALAVEEATLGLAPDERAELLARVSVGDLARLERSAAALNLAGLSGLPRLDAPPPALLRRLRADALALRADRGPDR